MLLDNKCGNWSKSQLCDGQDVDYKEKIATVIEKIVQCVEPAISDEGGQYKINLIFDTVYQYQ